MKNYCNIHWLIAWFTQCQNTLTSRVFEDQWLMVLSVAIPHPLDVSPRFPVLDLPIKGLRITKLRVMF